MKKNNQKLIIIIGLGLILSLIILYVGQFLFSEFKLKKYNFNTENTESPIIPHLEEQLLPVEYKHTSAVINSYKQEIFTLEFDPRDKNIEFKPALSFDSVFGFEKLSEICKKTDAYAAINAGFFFEYGEPVGMVAIDGNLIMKATGYSPVLVIDSNGASFKNIRSELAFIYNEKKIPINDINRIAKGDSVIIYTHDFGSTNRAKANNTSIRVNQDLVTAVIKSAEHVKLEKDSYLISFFGENAALPDELGIKVGDKVNIEIKPELKEKYHAYECGSMLVKDGVSVAPDKDRWVGTLNNRDPRTAIGIKENGRVVLVVVDGRQPGYSTGFTGKELAEYLIGIGIKDAAMLDGGASSQMFVDGNLKNKPSDRGMERPVAGAFIVKITR